MLITIPNSTLTSDVLLSASKTVLDNRNLKAKEKEDGAAQKLMVRKLKAIESYKVFKSGAKVTVAMWTCMLKYILIATKSEDTISSFKTKKDIESRLKSTDNWEDLMTELKTEIKDTNKTIDNTDIIPKKLLFEEGDI